MRTHRTAIPPASGCRRSPCAGGGLTAKYNYFTGSTDASDQINSIQINPASGNGITITYLRDPSDKARIDQVGYTGSSGNVLTDATINDLGNGNFNQIDQITGRHVSRTKLVNTNGTITSQSEDDRYNYQYDPNHADALTAVLDANTNASLYGYSFDNVAQPHQPGHAQQRQRIPPASPTTPGTI